MPRSGDAVRLPDVDLVDGTIIIDGSILSVVKERSGPDRRKGLVLVRLRMAPACKSGSGTS